MTSPVEPRAAGWPQRKRVSELVPFPGVGRPRIRQYAYFAIRSRDMAADEIEHRLGMPPDTVTVAGSKGLEPLRPAAHTWAIVCDDPRLRLDQQLDDVLSRLGPARAALKDVGATDGVFLVLQLVRYFDDDAGEQGDWQHRLLGWHLDRQQLAFLADIGAEVDADEYG